jgi:hypothetical protein
VRNCHPAAALSRPEGGRLPPLRSGWTRTPERAPSRALRWQPQHRPSVVRVLDVERAVDRFVDQLAAAGGFERAAASMSGRYGAAHLVGLVESGA